jgi:hypothetical protein
VGTVSHGKALCEVDWVVVQEVLDLDDPRVHNHTNREHLDLWPGAKTHHYGSRTKIILQVCLPEGIAHNIPRTRHLHIPSNVHEAAKHS